MSEHQLQFHGVSRQFDAVDGGRFTALSDVTLDVRTGEFLCLIGPSGCGKSTMLDLAAGLIRPSSGRVVFGGEPLESINSSVGYVTQRDTLLPWRSVRRNVGLPLEVQRYPRAERNARVDEVLAKVGLAGHGDRFPAQLSGGMLKRAAIAQTLSYRPSTILMDEPFGALDAQLRRALQDDVARLWAEDRTTVLFVTHDLDEAILLGDRIVVFGTDPGRIVHVETVAFDRPRSQEELLGRPAYIDVRRKLWTLLEH